MNVITGEDAIVLGEAETEHNNTILEMSVRKMNGHRLLKDPYFENEFDEEELAKMSDKEKIAIFYEEVMPGEDYPQVMDVINAAVLYFRLGVTLEGKSELVSALGLANMPALLT